MASTDYQHLEQQSLDTPVAPEQDRPLPLLSSNSDSSRNLENSINSLQTTRAVVTNVDHPLQPNQTIQTVDTLAAVRFPSTDSNLNQTQERHAHVHTRAEDQSLLRINSSEPILSSIESHDLSVPEHVYVHDNIDINNINQETYIDHGANYDTPLVRDSNSGDRGGETFPTSGDSTLLRTYSPLIQNGITTEQPCPTDTHIALSQVLTSFHDAGFNPLYVCPPTSTSIEDRRTGSYGQIEDAGDITIPTTNSSVHSSSSTQPPIIPSTIQDDPTLTTNELVALPRALPRRRYTTRDYSSGSVSSDDWLRHPDVVAFPMQDNPDSTLENQENIPPQSLAHVEGVTSENLRRIDNGFTPTSASVMHATGAPYTPFEDRAQTQPVEQDTQDVSRHHDLQEDHQVTRMIEDLTISGLTLPIVDPTVNNAITAPIVSDDDRTQPLQDAQSVDETEPVSAPASDPPTEVSHPDRLGLLGPLLSRTQPASATSPEDRLEFSLLGSTRPGFNSSILSMASRIRQARLMRLLRRMREREALGGYAERYPWVDTRSMVNHASGSRGTSRAGSLEDGFLDLGPDMSAHDAIAESSWNSIHHHDQSAPHLNPSPFYTIPPPSFTEILDCNGNPIEWGSDSSSNTSHEPVEERNSEQDWAQSSEMWRQRRAWMERTGRDRGIIRTHGRTRIVSTGTAFEGMEFISEADSLLLGNHRNQSLKSSWVTNPNGECWSDDDTDSPQRQRHGEDAEDKDQETSNVRAQPLLGILQPDSQYQPGAVSGTGLYQLYSNVRNYYGPENARRRRVMSEMTDLLRREQEWEWELERYEWELSAFRSRLFSRMASQPTDNSALSMTTLSQYPRMTTVGASTEAASTSSNPEVSSLVGLQQRDIAGSSSRSDIVFGRQGERNAPLWHRSDANGQSDGIVNEPAQGFHEYEQGNSHYHTQSISRRTQQQEPIFNQPTQYQHQSMPRQPTVAMMNRTPPPLPAQPQINEPIAHQIRRVQTPHMLTLQRQWEMQQQSVHQHQTPQYRQVQRQQQHQSADGPVIGSLENMSHQRNPNAVFIPPPAQQELHNNSFATASASSVPLSRGSRSSLRTSHESNSFQHFRLSGNSIPLRSQSAASFSLSSVVPLAPPDSQEATTSNVMTETGSGVGNAMNPILTLESLPTPSSISSADLPASISSSSSESQNHSDYRNQFYWRTRISGSNSLYVNYEGGKLKPEERWRRGKEDMVGR
ncbi:hypothetical protein BGX21_001542 [Mortierella sp. AD011]|nr:hypothetical protein BGX20_003441 [Mortierella sp. AD010]KAF9383606.1 hypothetical protein BGX21_001542 [Mortierella sp. AD011]